MPSVSRDNPAWADNNYWVSFTKLFSFRHLTHARGLFTQRGRSWAPMNFLVYQSLASYATVSPIVAAARAELAEQVCSVARRSTSVDVSLHYAACSPALHFCTTGLVAIKLVSVPNRFYCV